jgi:hypothetical protein
VPGPEAWKLEVGHVKYISVQYHPTPSLSAYRSKAESVSEPVLTPLTTPLLLFTVATLVLLLFQDALILF